MATFSSIRRGESETGSSADTIPGTIPATAEPAEGARTAWKGRYAGSRAENAQACLKSLLERADVPAFSHNLCKVMGLMGNDEISARLITNAIMQDYSLTLSVLRRANSAQYNRSNNPICSLARAVTLLGVEALRSLVGTMLYVEQYQKRSVPVRKLMLLALLNANHTRQLATKLGLPHPDMAYLCGMFCNLGEVLVAHYLPEQHAAILAEIEANRLSLPAASSRVLGFLYEDLGHAMAANWNLPDALAETMERPRIIPAKNCGPSDKLRMIVALSRDLTDAVYRVETNDSRAAINLVIEEYSIALNISLRLVQDVMSSAITDSKETFSSAGIPLNHLHLHRLSRTGPFADSAQASEGATEDESPAAAATDSGAGCAEAAEEDLLARLADEIEQTVNAGEISSGSALNEVVMMILEACHRGAGFDHVVFGLATPDRSMIRGRLGLGKDIESMIDMFRIAMSDPADPFALALAKQADLFVDNRQPNPFQLFRPLQTLGAAFFALYPVVVDAHVVGCLYMDRRADGNLPSQGLLEVAGRLRDKLALTIARGRSSTQPR